MKMPKKSLVIKVAIAIAIVLISLILLVSLKKPKGVSMSSAPSLIPATEGFEGDGMPEYEDVDYYVSEEDAES